VVAAIKIPVGPARGKTIHECSVAELEDACTLVEAKLCAARAGTTSAKHKRFVSAARALLKIRKFPTGSYNRTDEANRALRDAAEIGHLLAPSTQLAALLPGCAVLVSAFRASLTLDVYPSEERDGELVPNKSMLDRVANLLGVSWQAALCQRTDSRRNPHQRTYQAAAVIRDFDASERGIQAQAGIDLSEGAEAVQLLAGRVKDLRTELAKRRKFIDATCDTMARLRAIRTLGLQDSYKPFELERPFFVARVMFTADSDDPAVKQVFAQHVADRFGGASDALYGSPKRAAGER
jgi:hypothetical protein